MRPLPVYIPQVSLFTLWKRDLEELSKSSVQTEFTMRMTFLFGLSLDLFHHQYLALSVSLEDVS